MSNVYFKSSKEYLERANKVFEDQKRRIQALLLNADIQHIGSTAIPGSITKGDLDINVRVSKNDFDKAIEVLKQLYDVNQPENWNDTFASFKDENNLGIDFGLQLSIKDSKYDDFTKLRDVLINDPNLVQEYNQMKQKYEGKGMDEYRKEKANFFQKLRDKINKVSYKDILRLTAQISGALTSESIDHLVSGSLAFKVLTDDEKTMIHDVDIIVYEKGFDGITALLSDLRFNLNPIKTPYSIHANHKEYSGEDGKPFDFSFDSYEHYYQGAVDMSDYQNYPLDEGEIRLISKDGLINVYKKALTGSNTDKYPAYRKKIDRLNNE